MWFYSTRDENNRVRSSRAILQGLSEEGGLFVPESFPQIDLQEACRLEYPELATLILRQYLDDYDPDFLEKVAQKTYGDAFQGKAGELRQVEEGLYALELWHGPTCAFKDYALQLMPRLLVQAKENLDRKETTLILVATSGDTGKAALAGYRDLPGIRIQVFYPESGTSEIQRLQMATQEGENVAVWAVRGNFDDAQTGVKKAFADRQLEKALEEKNIRLSSANSINWGRLVPQIVYYFAAYGRLVRQGKVELGRKVDFCVPTGNFGDILAGYYAKRMGLPVGRLVCASNKNNVLTDFFATGCYDARREFYKTTSPSMDILISSNLERMLYHLLGSDEAVRARMDQLAKTGRYTIEGQDLARLKETFDAGCASDEEGAAQIRACFEEDGYLCDTHTAVAFKVAREYMARQEKPSPMVVLSTASPFKFPVAVLEALGRKAPENDFEALALLEQVSGQKAPDSLRQLKDKPVRFERVIRPDQIEAAALGQL